MLFPNTVSLGGLLVASLALIAPVSALPADHEANEIAERATFNKNDPTTWDTEYIKKTYITKPPAKDKCYFYTSGMSKDVKKWLPLNTKGGVVVNNVYDCDTAFSDKDGPMAWFLKRGGDKDLHDNWFTITSQAYAETCSGTVYMIIKKGQPIPSLAIWVTHEYPAIMQSIKSGKVKNIIIIDIDKKLKGDYVHGQTPNPTIPLNKDELRKLRRDLDDSATVEPEAGSEPYDETDTPGTDPDAVRKPDISGAKDLKAPYAKHVECPWIE